MPRFAHPKTAAACARIAFVLAIIGGSPAPVAQAQALDATAMLYSSQLRFEASGDPIVTVGLMEGQDEVRISAIGGLAVMMAGAHGGEVTFPPGSELRATIHQSAPGDTQYRVALDAAAGGNLEAIRAARTLWAKRGVTVEAVELGGVIGYPSRVLDNRKTILVEATRFSDQAAAKIRAAELGERWDDNEAPGVLTQPLSRAKGVVVITDSKTGITLRQSGSLQIASVGNGPLTVRRVEYGRGYAHHGFEDRPYHGTLVVAVDRNGTLAVVNRVSAELLLRGLVPAETFPTAPAAALQAQAITARGELLAKIGVRHLADPFLVCATQHCQVYSGRIKEKASTDEAVAHTQGQMLFSQKGRLVDSVYSASCGGHTEHNEHVWTGGPNPSLRGHADMSRRHKAPWPAGTIPTEAALTTWLGTKPTSWCASTRLGHHVVRWTRDFDAAEMERLVNARHDIGEIGAIQVLERGVSGRVRRVLFAGVKGSIIIAGELRVRRLLGNLRSGMFIVARDKKGGWRFKGGGYGHGVGMCQYGAIGMAEAGHSATDILTHYYTGATIERVY